MLSDGLKEKKRKYVVAYNQVVATSNALKIAINNLNSLINNQRQAYMIDGVSVFENRLNDVFEKLNKDYNKIISTILPGIKQVIDNLDEQIVDTLALETNLM